MLIIKWDFHRKEVDALSSTLMQCKETCQLAVSTAHLCVLYPFLDSHMLHLDSICNRSYSKCIQEDLQEKNKLLKRLLEEVVNNDKTVRRASIPLEG